MLPNILTSLRIVGAFCLIFTKPLSLAFFIIYTLSGITDVLDGFIARKTNNVTELGAKLDSVADISFYLIMLIKFFPHLQKKLPFWIWYAVFAIFILKVVSYTFAAVKFGKFSSLHTYLNKLCGLMVFFVPYVINFKIISVFCIIICAFGILSAIEEIGIHIKKSVYTSNVKSIYHDKK